MKKLILSNNTEVSIKECYAQSRYTQGAERDTLDIRLDPEVYTLDQTDQLFSPGACSRIIIQETITEQVETVVTEQVPVLAEDGSAVLDDEGNPVTREEQRTIRESVDRTNEYIYDNYTLRVALSKQHFTVADEAGDQKDEEQLSVIMAQKTYTEIRIDELTDTVDTLVLDSLMAE